MISQNPLQRLLAGNTRYINDKSTHPNRCGERRLEVATKQSPFAIIVGCSDSRAAPEIIFDEGLGDLFVVRVAGNVISSIEQESIDYSALNLDSKIILVLGHENCGAVSAVIQNNTGDIEEIAKLIEPAVQEADHQLEPAIKANAINMKKLLESSPNIKRLIADDKIQVVAAYLHLKTGLVEIIK